MVAEEYINMTHREVDRLQVVQAVVAKQLRQRQAADQLGIGVRQIKRLVRQFRLYGAAGLVSGHRGRKPNNLIAEDVKAAVLAQVRSCYSDFGPTLAQEKLLERDGLQVSVETLRQWMIADGLWQPKRRKQARIHQRRPRRPRFGELVQIDGSPHHWFEDRGPYCVLIVFIDDATSGLLALRFAPAETTQAYMETLRAYLDEHGRPVALYSDKHSIFRVNHPHRQGELTQFTRALKTLDIEPIHANSPQAKGRVERSNETLQDRLVKELRLQNINDIEPGNAFLDSYRADYNRRFAVAPRDSHDAHRQLLHSSDDLDLILCRQHRRILSRNLTLQFEHREYQLQGQGKGYRLRGAAVTLCEAFDGTVTILHEGRSLPYQILAEGEPPVPLDDEKSVPQTVDQARHKQQRRSSWKPTPDHPWKRIRAIDRAPV